MGRKRKEFLGGEGLEEEAGSVGLGCMDVGTEKVPESQVLGECVFLT